MHCEDQSGELDPPYFAHTQKGGSSKGHRVLIASWILTGWSTILYYNMSLGVATYDPEKKETVVLHL